jgi:diguanylate cyclase (GGDEF)-like protein/PAS domain S-box-containing protein
MPTTPTSTLQALTADADAVTVLRAALPRLRFRLDLCTTVAELQQHYAAQRPDVLLVDLDLGDELVGEALALLRDRFCNDWAPVILLCRNAADGERLARRMPGAIDFPIVKPLTEVALAERRVAMRRMIALRRVSRSALDRVSEAVIVIDERGTVRSFNGAAEALFGWTADQVIGRNVKILVPAVHRDQHDRYIRDYRRTGVAKVIGIGRVETAVRRDGSEFPMHLSVTDISDGSARRFVGVIRDLSVLQQRDELQQMIHHDSLTGLPNRAHAQEALARAMQCQATGGEGYSLLFCDVDKFKQINDSHGHRVGDEVLKAVGARLRHAVQEGDFVARFAGDEFLVILRGVTDSGRASRIAARIAAAVSQPVRVGDLDVGVGISIGASAAAHDESAAVVLDRADQRMYATKRGKHAAHHYRTHQTRSVHDNNEAATPCE